MTDDPDLNSAYALSGPEDTKRLYASWAETYDADFGVAQGYQTPKEIVRLFIAEGGTGPILDVGAGTGLVGEGLAAAGIGPVDALDLSDDMLAVAQRKGVYRDCIAADVTKPIPRQGYRGIVSAGTFTLGHVGPEGIPPLLASAEQGCLFVISVNVKHFEGAGFAALLAELETEIEGLRYEDIRFYSDKADLSHRYDMGRLMVFRKA